MLTRWTGVSRDFNRFIQTFRRSYPKDCNINYLRVVEEHKDKYPHIHTILQFPREYILRVENDRYFDRATYTRWRSHWKFGHSDYQKPRRNGTAALSYVLKYLIKNTTKTTVWRKILTQTQTSTDSTTKSNAQPSAAQIEQRRYANLQSIPTDGCATNTMPVRKYGVKLCSWSRGFDFTPFSNNTYQ